MSQLGAEGETGQQPSEKTEPHLSKPEVVVLASAIIHDGVHTPDEALLAEVVLLEGRRLLGQ